MNSNLTIWLFIVGTLIALLQVLVGCITAMIFRELRNTRDRLHKLEAADNRLVNALQRIADKVGADVGIL
jgi:hypothetical protein